MNKRQVLVIEDHEKTAQSVCDIAEEMGFTAHAVSNSKMIETAYGNVNPDIIILDLFMPEMDGVEVLQFLHKQFSKARIVILSSSNSTSRKIVERLGTALGFTIDANIQKPFKKAEMEEMFRRIAISLDDSKRSA